MNITEIINLIYITIAVIIGIVFLIGLIITIIQGGEIKFKEFVINRKKAPPPPDQNNIFDSSDDDKFTNLFIKFFAESRKTVLIGTGFYILRKDVIRKKLYPLIRAGRELEIYAANPFSPNVETRLIEEETGSPKPNIRKSGLEKWLREILEMKNSNPGAKFSLQLFSFYPTYALFIFNDRDYFFYPYGYAQLGTVSPVLHYSKDNPNHASMVIFFEDQYKLIKERSVDAELVLNLHPINKDKVDKSALIALAVYLIPSTDSPLYKFGSEILEYDVRSGKELQTTRWHNAIGAAFDYGLHVTIADALYFATEWDITLVCKELEALANEFQPFTLNLSLEKNFPNEKGIALICQDPTGLLEALHHELVARVYKKAVASNYNFDPTLADRDMDKERTKLMIKRYHAPYILQRFKPHFSLLSNVPLDKKDQLYLEIKKLYEKRILDSSVDIGKIAIMHKPDPKGHWQILQEYSLGGAS